VSSTAAEPSGHAKNVREACEFLRSLSIEPWKKCRAR